MKSRRILIKSWRIFRKSRRVFIHMQVDKFINEKHARLLLFFCGWSVSPTFFYTMKAEEDQDVWFVSDYRDLNFNEDLSVYRSVTLIAWSLGVWVAEQLFGGKSSVAWEQKIAINGTGCPIHDTEGIPEVIFRGTLDNLTPDGIRRFNRRMCGHKERLAAWERVSSRPLEEISDELRFLFQAIQARKDKPVSFSWDQAIVGLSDRIFPTANQLTHWRRRNVRIKEIEAPHDPFGLWKQWNELSVK